MIRNHHQVYAALRATVPDVPENVTGLATEMVHGGSANVKFYRESVVVGEMQLTAEQERAWQTQLAKQP